MRKGRVDNLDTFIKTQIQNRILAIFILLTVTLVSFTAFEVVHSVEDMTDRLKARLATLEALTIHREGKVEVQALDEKLKALNNSSPNFRIKWINDAGKLPRNGLEISSLSRLAYYRSMQDASGKALGYFVAEGSLWKETALFQEILTRVLILGVLTVFIFWLLFPLATKIPKSFILSPIQTTLELLKQGRLEPSLSNVKGDLQSIREIQEIQREIIALTMKVQQNSKEKAFLDLANQVVHDIRSPLAALQLSLSELNALPEETRLLFRTSVERIKSIANDLISNEKRRREVEKPVSRSTHLLAALIDIVISEKRVQYEKTRRIQLIDRYNEGGYGIFSNINADEFKRIISNLIDNAVEASDSGGFVEVSLNAHDGKALIVINDNGRGIPSELLSQLGVKGNTFGKLGGNGLGLFHAKSTIESWNGSLQIDSKFGFGTQVTIAIDIADPEPWFLPELRLNSDALVAVVDDDPSIHALWSQRLKKVDGIRIQHFHNTSEFESWCKSVELQRTHVLCLCDYEFIAEKVSGLAVLQSLRMMNNSVLVTSRFEQTEIQTECISFNLKLIPKPLAAFVPILVV